MRQSAVANIKKQWRKAADRGEFLDPRQLVEDLDIS